MMKNKIHWILQSNLIREQTLNAVKAALNKHKVSFEEIRVIPFSEEVPETSVEAEMCVLYGTTTLILNAYKSGRFKEGIFYDEAQFSIQNYLKQWKERMLNHDSEVLTFAEIVQQDFRKNKIWFVRPVADDKAFSGRLMNFEEMVKIQSELKDSNNPYLREDTLIAIGTPKTIEKEWRHFIVNKEIVSSCRYAKDGEVNVSPEDVPEELQRFVKDCCEIYAPHPIFVMDTALCDGQFYIVECNCFNDTGFYQHDIEAIFAAVNKFLLERG